MYEPAAGCVTFRRSPAPSCVNHTDYGTQLVGFASLDVVGACPGGPSGNERAKRICARSMAGTSRVQVPVALTALSIPCVGIAAAVRR